MKFLVLLFLVSCTQVTSLNLRKHQFGIMPTKIIWFQVAGLEQEQIAMLRFNKSGEQRTSFDENLCVGSTWNYNLYNVRSSAASSFLSQITGKKNIKESCEDAKLKPIWNYIYNNGYNTLIFESGANKGESLISLNECGDKKFLEPVYFYSRTTPPDGSLTYFHTEELPFNNGKVFYNRSCGKNDCGSSILEDFRVMSEKMQRVSQKHLLIVRDFSFLHALENKDLKKARSILADIERAYGEALSLTASNDYLVLLTTGDSRYVEMPKQGKDWFTFEKEGKNADVKTRKLTNMVFASGARAENFCGMYEEAQVFERILSGPKQQGLELKVINPFRN